MRARASIVLCLLLLLLLTANAQASRRVLERIDIENDNEIHIIFNLPLQYLTHTPKERGDFIRVNLKLAGTADATLEELAEESLPWSATDEMPLTDVRFRVDATTPNIEIQFAHEVEYTVEGGSGFRSITIKLTGNEHQQAVAAMRTGQAPGSAALNTSYPYVINLFSSIDAAVKKDLPDLPVLRQYRVYVADHQDKGKTWRRLRLGFFKDKAAAESVLDQLKADYPDAWVDQASPEERQGSEAMALTLPGGGADTTLPSSGLAEMQTPDGKPIDPGSREEKIARLMEEARQEMANKNYSRAVQLYTKVAEMPDNPWSRKALEFLGLARERKGQKAQALAVYEQYLQRFPKGEAAERVRQRQTGLLTATAAPQKKLRSSSRKRVAQGRDELGFDYFGGLSQFYRRDGILRNTDGHDLTQSSLINDLDLSGRVRKGSYELGTRFSGGYTWDLLDNGPGHDNRISAAYMEFLDTEHEHSLRAGRQSHNADGVLGRFDGLLAGYRVNDTLRVKGVLGTPVASSSNTGIDYDRYFYGLSADIGQIAERWDFNLFAIEQIADGAVDRRAVGGEVRYFRPGRSVFTLVDYDLLYNELNTFLMLGNITLESTRTTLNMTLDVRKSPILTTTNAIQGQGVTNLGGLLNKVSTGTARHLADDRSLDSRSLTLGGTQPLNDHYQLSAEMTASYLSGAPASGGVAASNSTGTDFFYSTQLIGSSLFKEGDVTIFGLRYNDVAASNTYTASLNTRYPVTREWRVNPRLRFDFRKNVDHTEQLTFRPEFRTTYRIKRRLQLEFEAGGEWTRQELSPRDRAESVSYFVNIGYRMEF